MPVPSQSETKKMKDLLDHLCVRLCWAGTTAVPLSFLRNPALIDVLRAAIQVTPSTQFPALNSKGKDLYTPPSDRRTQASIVEAQFKNMMQQISDAMEEILKFAYVPTLVLGHDMTTLNHGAALAVTLTGRDAEFQPFKRLVAIVKASSHTAVDTAKAVTDSFLRHFGEHHGRYSGGVGSDNASAARLACYHLIDLAEAYDSPDDVISPIRDFWACIGHKLALVLGYMAGKKDQTKVGSVVVTMFVCPFPSTADARVCACEVVTSSRGLLSRR